MQYGTVHYQSTVPYSIKHFICSDAIICPKAIPYFCHSSWSLSTVTLVSSYLDIFSHPRCFNFWCMHKLQPFWCLYLLDLPLMSRSILLPLKSWLIVIILTMSILVTVPWSISVLGCKEKWRFSVGKFVPHSEVVIGCLPYLKYKFSIRYSVLSEWFWWNK